MRLISKVVIRNFRSLEYVELDQLKSFSLLSGQNNSGKSNILRALSAFFTGETDLSVGLNVDSDYYKPNLKQRKRKNISVEVDFELPATFRFRHGLKEVEALLGGKSFSLTKRWYRDQLEPQFILNQDFAHPLKLEDVQRVKAFLSLISFRYIPNRVLPLEVIRREHQALRDVLVRRLGKSTPEREVFTALNETSVKLIDSISKNVTRIHPQIERVQLSTPSTWAEMLFTFGYRISEQGYMLDDALQGSGMQSLLMFETLQLIDQDYFQKFGWRQAAIWAIEEPESSLHTDLEVETAQMLYNLAHQERGRLQIVATTHSDIMIQHADIGYLVQKQNGSTSVEPMPRADLLEKSAKLGISRVANPLMFHRNQPLVLVDGKFDKIFFEAVKRFIKPKRDYVVEFLGSLTGEEGAGGRELKSYIRQNRNVIACRRPDNPVIVLLDWEESASVASLQSILPEPSVFRVKVWPEALADPAVGRTFKGIERFYPKSIFDCAIGQGLPIATQPDGELVVAPKVAPNLKRPLSDLIVANLKEADIEPLRLFLEEGILE